MVSESIQLLIRNWGNGKLRNFPWRFVDDPYIILVSEFMLHRTQALQVEPVFNIFITRYPSLYTFFQGNYQEIYEILMPLGLNWRIRNMIDALRQLWINYQSVPTEYEKLIAIHGIGQYIAGATVCFSTKQPYVLIDTNIVRVIGRLSGLDLSGEARRRKEIKTSINYFLDKSDPRFFYYSIIDIAHLICRPKSPDCSICPLNKFCVFYNQWFGHSFLE